MSLKDKILNKIQKYARDQVLGKGITQPRDRLQAQELADYEERLGNQCRLFSFIESEASGLYYPKQDAFVRAIERAPVTMFVGANQCLSGHELIYDPILRASRRIDELSEEHHVLAWNGERLVVALAMPSFSKGILPTLRVSLANGAVIDVAPKHRFLTTAGWRHADELLPGSALFLPESTSGNDQSVHAEDGQSSLQTAPGSRSDCRNGLSFDDEQPLGDQVSDQDGPPSRRDVQAHRLAANHLGGARVDAPACTPRRIHLDRVLDRLPSQDADGLIAVRCAVISDPVVGSSWSACSGQSRGETRSLLVSEDQLRAIAVGSLFPSLSKVCKPASDAPWLAVTSMEQTKSDIKWDFHVPGYENYWHGGVIHRNTGKTAALCATALSWAFGRYLWTENEDPVWNRLSGKEVKLPIRIFFGGKSFTMAHTEVTMKKFNELLPLEACGIMTDKQQGRSAHRIRFPEDLGGSEIKLVSYEQDPEDFEGTTWHLALWDEPPPRHAFIGTSRGCMKHHAPQAFALTPLREPWLFEEIYAAKRSVEVKRVEDLRKVTKKSYAIIDVDQNDSPYLTQETKDELNSKLDPEEIEARVHGKWKFLLGRVYKDFVEEKHVLDRGEWFEKNPNWKDYTLFMVVDPADRRPFAVAYGVVDPRGQITFIEEWPKEDFHRIKQWDNKTSEYVDIFGEIEARLGKPFFRLMDPRFGKQAKAGTGRTLVEEFDGYEIYFDTRIDNEIESGHMVVREALRNGTLFFLSNCRNLIGGMKNYTWDEYRHSPDGKNVKEKPMEMWKDFPDCVRYTLKYPVAFMDAVGANGVGRNSAHFNGGMGPGQWR